MYEAEKDGIVEEEVIIGWEQVEGRSLFDMTDYFIRFLSAIGYSKEAIYSALAEEIENVE